ncbi:MAG: hypothetical protein Q7J82_03810 [Coriobacteriia bacterium]|nr:hypothetical protein [Coriobacteriia bacterium]
MAPVAGVLAHPKCSQSLAEREVDRSMHRTGSTRPRKRPGHYAFASALQHSIEISRFTRICLKERHMHRSYGHAQYF